MIWDPEHLTAMGLRKTKYEYLTMPDFPTMKHIAQKLDYRLQDCHAFQHRAHNWRVWVKIGGDHFEEIPGILANLADSRT